MTSTNIKKYLLNLYLNGYHSQDTFYNQIIETLYIKIKNKAKLLHLEQDFLLLLGKYNAINAPVYHTMATKYLKSHQKNNTTDISCEIFSII